MFSFCLNREKYTEVQNQANEMAVYLEILILPHTLLNYAI